MVNSPAEVSLFSLLYQDTRSYIKILYNMARGDFFRFISAYVQQIIDNGMILHTIGLRILRDRIIFIIIWLHNCDRTVLVE